MIKVSTVRALSMAIWSTISASIEASEPSSLVLVVSSETTLTSISSEATTRGHRAGSIDEFARIIHVVLSHHLLKAIHVELAFEYFRVLIVEVLLNELGCLELLLAVAALINLSLRNQKSLLFDIFLFHLSKQVVIARRDYLFDTSLNSLTSCSCVMLLVRSSVLAQTDASLGNVPKMLRTTLCCQGSFIIIFLPAVETVGMNFT